VQATPSLQFQPGNITIAAGDSVKWQFGSVAHTVSFQKADSNPGDYGGEPSSVTPPADIPQSENATVARTFSSPGTYHYRCSIHPTMLGTVTVN
jgi:plastocyanin